MAIDWIYDTTYVSFGVDWDAHYKAVGKVTIQPVVYRWDRYNTADSSKFSETLRYEPNGSTGSWSDIGWGSGSGTRSVDTFSVRTYQRQASAYTVRLEIATDSGFGTAYDGYYHTIGEVTRTATYTVPALPPAFNTLSATRVSDNQVNLSWTAASGNIKAVCIERSVDGGSYSEVAVIWNASATSWQDNTTTADHSYTYRARYHHEGAYGSYSNTVTVTMTPSAPQTISTAAIQGSTNVAVTLDNTSPVATSLEWQASTDGGQTWGASSTVSGSPVTSFTATGISGTAYIRVRNVNSTGTSDWLVSEQVTTICPPAAPTLISPTGVLDMSGGSVTFAWRHNPLDGSSQTAAQLDYSTNGGSTWTTVTKSTEESHTISPIPWAAGTLVTWRVRTKGADANYGDWAQAVQFDVYTAPTLNITSPGATITGMPISLTATYSDMAGYSCQAATVSLTQNGRTLFSEPATINGTSITSSLDVSEFLPTNGESYTVVLTARSSSGLSTSANATFTVDFVEPQAGELSVVNNPDTGYASLLATFDNSASEITYTGSTNEQYESTDGYVRSLTVEGKSERVVGKNLLPATLQVNGTNINQSRCTVTLSGDEFSFAAANTDMSFGYTTYSAGVAYQDSFGALMPVTAGSSYTLTCTNTAFNKQFILWWNVSRQTISTTSFSSNVGTATAPSGAAYASLRIGKGDSVNGTTYTTKVQFEQGSAPTQYEPYFAPYLVSIEGVGVRGRNLATTAVYKQDYVIGGSGAESAATNYIITEAVPVEAGETYAGSYGHADPSSTDPLRVGIYTSDMTFISRPVINESTTAITMPSNAAFVRFSYSTAGSNALTDVMFSKGSTPAPYEPYSLTTITTPLRSAGSVHDTLMADADSWTVGRKVGVVDLGTLTWTRNATAGHERLYTDVIANLINAPSANSVVANMLCAQFGNATANQTYNHNTDNTVSIDTNGYILIYASAYTDAASFKAAMSGVYLFYELATPTVDTETSMSRIEIGSAFTVATDLDSTFELTTWDGSADAVSVSVSRVNADGTITPLLTDGASGSGVVDKYAPLNTPYQYAVTTTAASQAVKTVYVDNELVTDLWFVYWGEKIASAKWNPDNGGIQVTRPQKTRVYYAGRRDPVSYDGHAVSLTETPSWMFLGKDEVDTFVGLIEDGGRGVYKSCDGWVYHADFDLTMTPSYTAIGYYGGASLGIIRIAGEKL